MGEIQKTREILRGYRGEVQGGRNPARAFDNLNLCIIVLKLDKEVN